MLKLVRQDANRGPRRDPDRFAVAAFSQAGYYATTGIWPLVHIRSFVKITGPKTDVWLVKTAGTLIAVIGAVLGLAGARRQESPEIPLLGVGSAAGLAAIDIIYVTKKRIRPVYLFDALAEVGLIGLWCLARPAKRDG